MEAIISTAKPRPILRPAGRRAFFLDRFSPAALAIGEEIEADHDEKKQHATRKIQNQIVHARRLLDARLFRFELTRSFCQTETEWDFSVQTLRKGLRRGQAAVVSGGPAVGVHRAQVAVDFSFTGRLRQHPQQRRSGKAIPAARRYEGLIARPRRREQLHQQKGRFEADDLILAALDQHHVGLAGRHLDR